MARYKIASLNYIASGSKRTLVNVDTQMVHQNIKNIYILSHEKDHLSNIVTEQFDYNYLPTEYIEKEHPINEEFPGTVHRPVEGDPHSLSTEPLSEEKKLSSIILNEKQLYGYESDPSAFMRILLQLSSDTYGAINANAQFRRYEKNRTYVVEDETSTRGYGNRNSFRVNPGDNVPSLYVYPMYDIRDVSIKSYLRKQQVNQTLAVNPDYLGNFVDIYCPDMSAQPLGFCQMNNDAYLVTDRTRKKPYMVGTSHLSTRRSVEVDDFYDIALSSGEIETYLYRTPQDFGTSSLQEALSNGVSPLEVFTPAKSMRNMDYNYLVVVDQTVNRSKYDVGDIYAQQLDTAKNAYDSLYSMNISSDVDGTMHANQCREYCGIFTDSQRVYLKYYDNVNYVPVSSWTEDGVVKYGMDEPSRRMYPFQKVETYMPNNFETRCKHKSNLFSISVKNKGIKQLVDDAASMDEETRDVCQRYYDQIHKEIKNAIKSIAENICPVNTQFFDVYFDD